MTQEEKAKAYDEAIERYKAKQEYECQKVHEFIEYLFPELKESEDERIRKEIIDIIDSYDVAHLKAAGLPSRIPKYIAWLEKQGKNNMGISEATKKELEDNLNKALEKETAESWNEFLDEQNPADKVEPKFKAGDRVIGIVSGMQYYITDVCDDCYYTESGCTIMFYAQDNFELSKQNPAWSEEDKKMSRFIGNAITAADASEYLGSKGLQVIDAHVWLENLKDRVQPQPKQEWSEEDRLHYMNVLEALEYVKGCKSDYDKIEAVKSDIAWFKSLKERYTWKPSDEQINALCWVLDKIKNYPIGGYSISVTHDLLKQLKAL